MVGMRKLCAWLGAASLVVLWSVSVHAGSGTVLKPYVVLILDTSGSMVGTAYGNPTGFGPPSCGGIDNKLNHAKCAIYNIANSYGDIDLALARFRNVTSGTTTAATFPTGCCSHGPDAGSCNGSSITCTAGDSMFELLAPIIDGTNGATAVFVNGTGDTCSVTSGGDPEIWNADSNTPLGGVLLGDKDYWTGIVTATDGTGRIIWPSSSGGYSPIVNDPTNAVFLPKSGETACDPNPDTCDATATCTGATCCCVSQCRPYITIVLTDGDETCGGNANAAAASLLATDIGAGVNKKRYRVVTKAIGFGVPEGYAQIESIAHGGGAPDVPGVNEGYYAQDEAGLELAISQIIEGSIRSETCNNLDDDCDTKIDEDFPTKGNACDNGQLGVCKTTGTLVCKADGTGLQCNAPAGASPGTEICNGLDDDCDGIVDEGLTGCTCNPTAEICNGKDDNCNNIVDDMPPQNCAITNSYGSCPGTQTCAWTMGCTGTGCYTACTGPQTPGPEQCDGIDNNCDGVCDGFNAACSNVRVPGGPASDNLGDPSHNPIPQNVCHPGQKNCPAQCGAGNNFGACSGEVEGCNPQQDVNVHCDLCNGLDDDCDNKIDEDFVPADCSTNCGIGQTQCVNGQIVCNSMPAGNDTTCDGIDDDCDGQIDEDWVCDPSPTCTGPNCCKCGTGTTCEQTKCINGQPTCQASQPIDPEQCNCLDDDCDGTVDENTTCGNGGQCIQCQCAFQCSQGEFPCPLGKKCDAGYCVTDPCYGVTCGPDGQGNATVCQPKPGDPTNAECVAACSVTTCPNGLVCVPATGECKPNDCTTFPDMCTAQQSCVFDPTNGTASCVTNLCAGVTCPADKYCEGGNCVASCADVTCPTGQRCRLGVCEADPCGHPCPFGQACDDASGMCHDDPCKFRDCGLGNWCNPNDGACEADPCVGTMCPSPDQVCKGGTCYNPDQFLPDAGIDQHVTVGGGGCNTSGGDVTWIFGLALLAVRRRRQGGVQ